MVCQHELAMKTKWYGDRHWAEQHKKDSDYDYNQQIVHVDSPLAPKKIKKKKKHFCVKKHFMLVISAGMIPLAYDHICSLVTLFLDSNLGRKECKIWLD